MQPPPRKAKATTALRNIHNEQLTKLQAKHQLDVDFLEDIRNFSKLRAAIEKEYGQALFKLATVHLQRKIPNFPEVKSENGESYKTVYSVWRALLDETEKIGKARLAAAEVYQQQISESAKTVRASKLHLAKKCFDNLRKMHEDLQHCVIEVDKTKKLYFEEEHMAHEARDKAHDAEEKLKKKKGRIFQSISSLQKTSTKFSFRKEACDIQATKARNDYILSLVAANAHQARFYDMNLPELIQIVDCDIYDKIKEYIQLISRTELLTCAACQSSFTTIEEQAHMVTRQYTAECFLQDNSVLSKVIQYEFEPCDNDSITRISTEHNAGLCLSKEAKKWVSCIMKENRTLRDSGKELHKVQAQQLSLEKQVADSSTGEQGPHVDLEARIDELKQIIRRSEASKAMAEARIEAMRDGGVNVEEFTKNTDIDSLGLDQGDNLSRSGTISSRGSRKSIQSENLDEGANEANESYYDSDFNEAASDLPGTPQSRVATDSPIVAGTSEYDAAAAAQSAWEASEETVTQTEYVGEEATSTTADVTTTYEDSISAVTKCIAFFTYEASNADELSFVEQEELELVSMGDGDGWVKARNYRGEEGFIPQNYVELSEEQQVVPTTESAPVSFSSVDYTMPGEEEGQLPAPSEISDLEPKAKFCQSLFEYEASSDGELSFTEGQIIKILSKIAHADIDDGWWKGEINGIIGVFPSLVVKEINDYGELETPHQEIGSPLESFPPPTFSPPKPQCMIPPAQVILTQPTPEVETTDGESKPPTQTSEVETTYAPLVSSPESPTRTLTGDKGKGDTSKEKGDEDECPVTVTITEPDTEARTRQDFEESSEGSPAPDDHTEFTYCSGEEVDKAIGNAEEVTFQSEEKPVEKEEGAVGGASNFVSNLESALVDEDKEGNSFGLASDVNINTLNNDDLKEQSNKKAVEEPKDRVEKKLKKESEESFSKSTEKQADASSVQEMEIDEEEESAKTG